MVNVYFLMLQQTKKLTQTFDKYKDNMVFAIRS